MNRDRDGRKCSGTDRRCGNQTRGGRRRLSMVVVTILTFGLTGGHTEASGPEGAVVAGSAATVSASSLGATLSQGESRMRASIRQLDEEGQHIRLTLGRSAVVDVDQPFVRAQVSNPEIADVTVLSPRQLLITSRSVGQTQLMLWDEEQKQLSMSVVVQMDIVQLRAAIAEAVPGAVVDIQAINDALLLTGTVPDVDSAQYVAELAGLFSNDIKNQLRVAGTQQVLLRCTVAEVSKSAVRQLGINGWMGGDHWRDVFFVNQIAGINPANIGGGPAGDITQGIRFATDTAGLPLLPSTDFSVGFPKLQMQLFFQALRRNGLLRVLAEPNLVALSGQEASFLAGGEFPIPVPQAGQAGATTITIEFKEFGVRLTFTPTVIGHDRIRLQVAPEVSEQDFANAVQFGGFVVPALTQRRANTTVELTSGSTIAIAGLLSDASRASASRLPGLGDVPVLGSLFRSVEYRRNRTELVILVTPELVSSMSPDQVAAVPGQFMTEPDDWELFGLGLLEGEPMEDTTTPDDALSQGHTPKARLYRGGDPEQTSLHGPWGPAEEHEAAVR